MRTQTLRFCCVTKQACSSTNKHTAALLATGSQDATVLVHSLSPEVEEPLERYTGHTALVTTITHQHGQLVSGSWDRYAVESNLSAQSVTLQMREMALKV